MTQETTETVRYELMLILSPELGEEASGVELDELRKSIKSHGGGIFAEDLHGLRDLTYKIKKHARGFYAVFLIDLPAEKVDAIQKDLNIHPSVLRFLFLKVPATYELVTLAEYDEIAAKDMEERKKSRKAKERKAEGKPPVKKAVAKEEPKPEAKPEAKPEPKPETATSAAEPAEEAPKEAVTNVEKPKTEQHKPTKDELDAVDEKLKSIINDPDITL